MGCGNWVALRAIAQGALDASRTDKIVAESLSAVGAGKVGVASGVEDASGSVEIGSTVTSQAN